MRSSAPKHRDVPARVPDGQACTTREYLNEVWSRLVEHLRPAGLRRAHRRP